MHRLAARRPSRIGPPVCKNSTATSRSIGRSAPARSSSKTPALDQFTLNLTERARSQWNGNGQLDMAYEGMEIDLAADVARETAELADR